MARAPAERALIAQDAEVVAKGDAGQPLAQQKAAGSRAGGTMRNAIMGAFGSQGLPAAAPVEVAPPTAGSNLDQASRNDAVQERSSRQSIIQNNNSETSGGDGKGKGKDDIDQDKPGHVEPPDSRDRFKELYGLYSGMGV